jgi:hypothetical protein
MYTVMDFRVTQKASNYFTNCAIFYFSRTLLHGIINLAITVKT